MPSIVIKISEEEKELLRKRAEDDDVSISQLLHEFIEDYLKTDSRKRITLNNGQEVLEHFEQIKRKAKEKVKVSPQMIANSNRDKLEKMFAEKWKSISLKKGKGIVLFWCDDKCNFVEITINGDKYLKVDVFYKDCGYWRDMWDMEEFELAFADVAKRGFREFIENYEEIESELYPF